MKKLMYVIVVLVIICIIPKTAHNEPIHRFTYEELKCNGPIKDGHTSIITDNETEVQYLVIWHVKGVGVCKLEKKEEVIEYEEEYEETSYED